jgi:hypothetical protein
MALRCIRASVDLARSSLQIRRSRAVALPVRSGGELRRGIA